MNFAQLYPITWPRCLEAKMPDPLNDLTRRRMRSQVRRDTRPELALRSELHALGFRFRVDYAPEVDLRSRGDIVFTRRRLVVFVDGCFWHGCPEHATAPKNNAGWWRQKIRANQERDRRTDSALESRGWQVIRVWEHERAIEAARRIASILARD
ncbi:very short patch repair endonuclease [Kribbella sp. NBC_01484]|uniref:very short patch repair endonuclease n=1 Tax=Kribbella sp. NBC_01484 TaxID=2903579 RepID=UPI003FA5F450